ncbi:glycosyltransferase [Arthrobacter citreus]|uniref:glycosyltransferase n=1 Tax=Arthrobacter TaxID=1663 RepID=UPI0012642E7E|nr:glycosyltransferase [Arthrobacter gandavensis]
MSSYSDKLYAPFVFYTRFGIGVFDESWLDFRIRAFGAITLPSVSRLLRPEDKWFIFLDRDMPLERLREFRALVDANPAASRIELVFVRYAFEVADALEDRLRLSMPGGPMYLTRIDDDDALRHDTVDLFLDLALRTEGDKLFMSATSAIEFFPVERLVLEGRHDLLVNVAYGLAEDVHGFARGGHHTLLGWAERTGKTVALLDARHSVFLYNRHRQSSSRFTSRRSTARDSADSRKWLSSDFRMFNLDVDRLVEFRLFAATAPYAKEGSAWTDSDEQTALALSQFSALRSLKTDLLNRRVTLLKDAQESPIA